MDATHEKELSDTSEPILYFFGTCLFHLITYRSSSIRNRWQLQLLLKEILSIQMKVKSHAPFYLLLFRYSSLHMPSHIVFFTIIFIGHFQPSVKYALFHKDDWEHYILYYSLSKAAGEARTLLFSFNWKKIRQIVNMHGIS